MSYELLLVCGIYALYVWDSAVLLYANEVLFIRSRGAWKYVLPDSGWPILKKSLLLPGLCRPDQPVLRCHWSIYSEPEGVDTEKGSDLERVLHATAPMSYVVLPLAIALLVAVPVMVTSKHTGWGLVGLLVFVYVAILVVIGYAYVHRSELPVTTRGLLKLAFDALACPPLAVGFYRKIWLGFAAREDLLTLAASTLEPTDFETFVGKLRAITDNELEYEDQSTPRHSALQAYKARLERTMT